MPKEDPQPLAGPLQTGVPTISYPTPLKSDLIIMEYVDTQGPSYQALDYGSDYADQINYPGYKLTLQTPVSHKMVKRFWASDRISQETYDYALQYVSEGSAYPIYIRSSVVALSEYVALSDGSLDPVDASAILVHQEMKGLGEQVQPEIANLYRQVVRVYQRVSGPTLTGHTQTSDGLEATITVIKDAAAATAADTGFLVIQSEVDPKSVVLGDKKTVTTTSYPDQPGQEYRPALNLLFPFVQKTVTYGTDLGQAGTNISPGDYLRATERVYDLAAIQTAMLGYHYSYVVYGTLDIPPVMNGLAAVYVKSFGNGAGASTGTNTSTGTHQYSIDLKGSGSAESNVSCIPEMIEDMHYTWGKQLPFTVLELFVAGPTASEANVIAAIATLFSLTVNPSIKWNPQEITGYTTGQNIRMQGKAGGSYNFSAWANGTESGSTEGLSADIDKNYSVENTTRVITYPPCIHGAITVSGGATDSQALAITATAAIQAGSVDAGFTATANGAVHFTIAATTPAAVPTSGLYLYSLESEPAEFGPIKVIARVFDFANLPV